MPPRNQDPQRAHLGHHLSRGRLTGIRYPSLTALALKPPKTPYPIVPTKPTPELIAFCQKLTREIAVAFLTDETLKGPLKGFPPNQPNLISAIETGLKEI